jgi:hypothetical protein
MFEDGRDIIRKVLGLGFSHTRPKDPAGGIGSRCAAGVATNGCANRVTSGDFS